MSIWQELSREEIFSAYGRGIEKRRYRLPHGKETDFYVNTGKDSVLCLAFTEKKKILLVEQFRVGPGRICQDIPGGGVNDEEDRVKAMERELLEETGYCGKVKFIRTISPSPYGSYKEHVFVATDCKQVSEPLPEENGENLKVVEMTLEEFRAHLQLGDITGVQAGYIGLEYLDLL